MILHCYLTNSFFPWAKLFLTSYKFHNGIDKKIILSTRELSEDQINELYSLYENLEIINSKIDIENMVMKTGIELKQLLKFKKEIELLHITEKNKIWKLMIAAEDRIKSILDVMIRNKHEDFMVHIDIDLYIRYSLDELFSFIKNHDISIKLILDSKLNKKTMIGIQGYKINNTSVNFLKYWIKHIEEIHPKDRPMDYGQITCSYTCQEFYNRVKWGSIQGKFISSEMLDTDIIWNTNISKGKIDNLKICYEDFEKMKN